MALFKINDIIFNKESKTPRGPLSSLYDSKYKYNQLKYPIDLGSSDKGHYVVFHINEQEKTQFPSSSTGDVPTIAANRKILETMRGSTNVGGNLRGIIDAGSSFANDINKQFGIGEKLGGLIDSAKGKIGDIFGQSGKTTLNNLGASVEGANKVIEDSNKILNNSNFLRATRRTTDSIALYMPDTLQFDYGQNYSDVAMGEGMFGLLTSAGGSLKDILDKAQGKEAAAEIGNKAALFTTTELASRLFGNQGRAAAAGATGVVQNPKLELLYSSPAFRQFQFAFKFYPRDRTEAKEVINIIRLLRFHQAPEILKNTGGFFMVPPSEFDIEFYYNGKRNPNIHKISTCVMTNMQVNFSPDGFATYEIPGDLTPDFGGTGMPVSIEMVLEFKETEILTKESFADDVERTPAEGLVSVGTLRR